MRLTCCELTINKRFRIIKSVNKYVGLNNKHIAAVPNFRETRKVLEMIREYIKSDAMKEPNALMYKLVFLILMDTGVRRSELVKIERENIDMKNREIKLVKTKNKDERVVFFSAVTLEYIQMMLEIKVDHEYLLHNVDKNRAMNLYDLGYIIKKYKRKFNLKKFHPHIFRHSFITLWLQNGATQKEVSGIKTNDVLDRYWHIAKNQVKESYNLRYNLDQISPSILAATTV